MMADRVGGPVDQWTWNEASRSASKTDKPWATLLMCQSKNRISASELRCIEVSWAIAKESDPLKALFSGSEGVSAVSDSLLGSAEIASVRVHWFAFFPPRFYTDWITRSAVILPAPMDGRRRGRA